MTIYTVKPGDTLSQVARDNSTSLKNIRLLNNILNENAIKPGDRIVVKYETYNADAIKLLQRNLPTLAQDIVRYWDSQCRLGTDKSADLAWLERNTRPKTPPAPPVEPPVIEPGTKPTEANTGIKPNSTLTVHSGNLVVKTDGAVIKDLSITGNLYIVASNVTIENVKTNLVRINQDNQGNYPHPAKGNIVLKYVDCKTIDNVGFDGLTIQNCKIRGARASTHIQLTNYAENGKTWVARNLLMENNLFYPSIATPDIGAHLENFHPMGLTDAIIRNNVFNSLAPDNATLRQTTAAFFMQTWNGVTCDNWTIENNWFYGGGYYQAYFLGKNMIVRNNRFHSYEGMAGIVYPPSQYAQYWPFTQTGNTLDGQPYTLPNVK